VIRSDFRAEFPVLERIAYLNTGSNGPVPARGVAAAEAALRVQADEGRGGDAFWEWVMPRMEQLRARVAGLLDCDPDELAITGATTDGVNTVLSALELGPGDEVLTSDQEHPGVLAPLGVGRARRGFEVRVVPFDDVAAEVGPRTQLVAVSHVSWHTGRMADTEALAGVDAQVLLDGAQGLGAVPVDVKALGCDFYAASGQKWLCGPNGLGYLYVRAEHVEKLLPPAPGFGSVTSPDRTLDLDLQPDARRFDSGVVAPHQSAWALAALDVLEGPGIAAVHGRARALAARLAGALAEAGKSVAPRGNSTLVSWEADDPPGETARLANQGIVVRNLPGTPYVRASVGAWSSEEELERLAELAASTGPKG
jgi:selenocysteine lyase/cysteine desulfurase